MTTWLTPRERASRTVSTSPLRQVRRLTPGMEAMGSFLSPSCTKTGRMKFAGEMCVSDIALRNVLERRFAARPRGEVLRRQGNHVALLKARSLPYIRLAGRHDVCK